jgi:hypothetical protein
MPIAAVDDKKRMNPRLRPGTKGDARARAALSVMSP